VCLYEKAGWGGKSIFADLSCNLNHLAAAILSALIISRLATQGRRKKLVHKTVARKLFKIIAGHDDPAKGPKNQVPCCEPHNRAGPAQEDDMWLPQRDYNYSVATYRAHCHASYVADTVHGTSRQKQYDSSVHGLLYGEFAHIRSTLDYSWHTNYTPQRQAWQDSIIRRMMTDTTAQKDPWVIFTCGAMGSGKGYVMRWLSEHSEFPLRNLVHIDPDKFKGAMPEWDGYIRHDAESAGTKCHKESGFLQELAQEVAMSSHRHVWIDGSLGDAEWYENVFLGMRKRFPHYRIAIVYVHCSAEKVFERAERRGRETGRYVPKPLLQMSIQKTRQSIAKLAPLADFALKVDNNSDTLLCSHHARRTSSSSFLHSCAEESKILPEQFCTFVRTANQELQTRWIEEMPPCAHSMARVHVGQP